MPIKKPNQNQAKAKHKDLDKLCMREIDAVRLTISVPRRMFVELKARAKLERCSVNQLLRQAADQYLLEKEEPLSRLERQRRVVKAISESTKDFKTGRYEP